MPSAALLLVAKVLAGQLEDSGAEVSTGRFYHAARLILALLVATLVPFLIDRRARRTSR